MTRNLYQDILICHGLLFYYTALYRKYKIKTRVGDSTKLVSQWRLDSWLMVLGVNFWSGGPFLCAWFQVTMAFIWWNKQNFLNFIRKPLWRVKVTTDHLVKRKQTRNSLFFMVSSLSDINSCFWHSGVVTFMTFAIVFCKMLACSFERLVGFYWSSKTGTGQVIRGHVIAKRSPLLLGSVTIYSNTKVFPLNKTPVY